MSDKRNLVYKMVNGRVNVEIQHGNHTTGTNETKQNGELKRYEIIPDHYDKTIFELKELYPFEMVTK